MPATLYSLAEQVMLLLKGGDPSQSSSVRIGEAKAIVSQLINQKIKGEYFAVTMGDGERIPDGNMIATYENVAVSQHGEVAKAILPCNYTHLPKGMGVWQVSPTGVYVSGSYSGSNTGQTPNDLEYIIGSTSGAPTAGASTFTKSSLIGFNIRLYIGRVLQSQVNDGSGVYYSYNITTGTITLNGYTWGSGDLVQIQPY